MLLSLEDKIILAAQFNQYAEIVEHHVGQSTIFETISKGAVQGEIPSLYLDSYLNKALENIRDLAQGKSHLKINSTVSGDTLLQYILHLVKQYSQRMADAENILKFDQLQHRVLELEETIRDLRSKSARETNSSTKIERPGLFRKMTM